MSPADRTVELELSGPVATLRLNRPAVRNALNRQMLAELAACLDRLEADETVAAAIVTGAGEAFSAGADIEELLAGGGELGSDSVLSYSQQLERLAVLPMPVVAAVHGFALGGGFLILLYCDLRIVAEGTRLGFPEAARHWLPPWGMSRLAAWVGAARAEQIMLTAGAFDAAQAHRLGLADQVVPAETLIAEANEIAARLARTPRHVAREVRTFFTALRGRPHAEWDRLSAEAFARCFAAPEAQAALAAFLKRGAADTKGAQT